MNDRVFIDTNILIYYYSSDEINKSDKIRDILSSNDIVISTQIVNEFSNVMLKKFDKDPIELQKLLKVFEKEFEIVNLIPELTHDAIKIKQKYKFSFWDSLVVSSALYSKCNILYTEDLSHNQMIDKKLQIINPFV